VIRGLLRDLPCWIDTDTRAHAEAQLAEFATQYRPEQLGKLANKLADCLNPDGDFSDEDRARRRGLMLGKQDADGMSLLRGWLTPAARAALEVVLAKLAAPGMADPYAEKPVLDGTPSQDAIDRDARSPAQRNHDGAAGPPANTPTAPPNGSHHPTKTTTSPAPTPSTTPKNCSTTTPTTKPNLNAAQGRPTRQLPHPTLEGTLTRTGDGNEHNAETTGKTSMDK
jgi:hypothetical protein